MAKTKDWRIPGPPKLRYTKAEVLAMFDGNMSESTLDALIADSRFPAGHKATPQAPPYWSGQVLACWFFLGQYMAPPPTRKAKAEE